MSKRIGWSSCLLIAALCAPWAAAQVNYKSTMPDGKVIYGDKPVPGAAKVDQLKAPPTQGITPPSGKERAMLRDMEKSRAASDAKEQKVRAAQDAVSRAEAALAAGKEPLASERIGTAGGASRLNEAYYDRQKQLEAAVVKARADLAAARTYEPPAPQSSKQREMDVPFSGISPKALRDK
jgi:hypothetical protein